MASLLSPSATASASTSTSTSTGASGKPTTPLLSPSSSHLSSHSNAAQQQTTRAQIQDLIEDLRSPGKIQDADALLATLARPLERVGLLAPLFRGYLGLYSGRNGRGEGREGKEEGMEIDIRRHVPQIQRVLLSHIVPTWGEVLRDPVNGKGNGKGDGMALIDQYFCPDAFVNGSEAAGEVARAAYATLVSAPGALSFGLGGTGGGGGESTGEGYGYGVKMLARLAVEYPVDRLYKAVFLRSQSNGKGKELLREMGWEDCVRDVCKVPVVVANALADAQGGGGAWGGRRRGEIPEVLENAVYFNRVSERCEELVWELSSSSSSSSSSSVEQESLTYLLTKLVNHGVFPPHPPVARSQPSFFQAALPAIRARLSFESKEKYSAFWTALFQHIAASSSISLQSILASLFASLHISLPSSPSPSSSSSLSPSVVPTLSQDTHTRALVKREAALLHALLGGPSPSSSSSSAFWQIATSLVMSRDWPQAELHARVFVAWVSAGASLSSLSSAGNGDRDAQGKATAVVDLKALDAFLGAVLDVWAAPEHIKHSLIARHRYTTSLLLLTISYFPSSSPSSPAPQTTALVSSPAFISSIGTYIAHLDPAVRRCGMLAAEVVAHACGRQLDFGGWGGDGDGGDQRGEGLGWCRAMRGLLAERDVDVDVDIDAAELDDESTKPQSNSPAPASISAPASTRARATFLPPTSGYDSDDSLTGYTSPLSASSSRSSSPSPTPAELAEIEKDPTLSVGRARVARPVYLAQLGELLRGGGGGGVGGGGKGKDDAHEADRLQMALDCAEGLVRRKRGYGSELDENAVNLVYALLSLQDNYELDGFAEKRQAALTALVVCAPVKAVAALIQEFFKNQYSTDQRFVALNALAMGARELADMPVAPTSTSTATTTKRKPAFPSKTLPGHLHRKYISEGDVGGRKQQADRALLPRMVEQLASDALKEHSDEAEAETTGTTTRGSVAIIRERRLRVQKQGQGPQLISEIPSSSSLNPFSSSSSHPKNPTPQTSKPPPTYLPLAASTFILPLTTAFWSFLHSALALEQRTAHLSGPGRARYAGAGTGLVLSPLVLAQWVRTLAVLVHAGRNAPEWMGVVAPEVMEVALALGVRRVSRLEEEEAGEGDEEDDGEAQKDASKNGPQAGGGPNKEASLLTATLELALVVLDGALALDGGRVLGLEHTALVLGVGEWAGKVFGALERGKRVQGGGGAHEARLGRAAAGVLLKIDELTSRWSRSMIDV